uniref:Arabinogalactan peptide 16 n=3 Tax=Setaria TaxID=4554 RepID=K3YVR2_SETIT
MMPRTPPHNVRRDQAHHVTAQKLRLPPYASGPSKSGPSCSVMGLPVGHNAAEAYPSLEIENLPPPQSQLAPLGAVPLHEPLAAGPRNRGSFGTRLSLERRRVRGRCRCVAWWPCRSSVPSLPLPRRRRTSRGGGMAAARSPLGAIAVAALVVAIFMPAAAAAAQAPAPAPTSDGTSIDLGIAYVLMLVALVLTYLIHPLDASSPYKLF